MNTGNLFPGVSLTALASGQHLCWHKPPTPVPQKQGKKQCSWGELQRLCQGCLWCSYFTSAWGLQEWNRADVPGYIMSHFPMVLSLVPEADFWEKHNERWCNFLCKPSCLRLSVAWGEPSSWALWVLGDPLWVSLLWPHRAPWKKQDKPLPSKASVSDLVPNSGWSVCFEPGNPSWCPYPSIYLFLFVSGCQLSSPSSTSLTMFLPTSFWGWEVLTYSCLIFPASLPWISPLLPMVSCDDGWSRATSTSGLYPDSIIAAEENASPDQTSPLRVLPGFSSGMGYLSKVGSRQSLNWKNNSGAV